MVLEIDPANPHWWEKVKLPSIPRLPRLPKGPLGNGCVQTVRHPLGELVQLKPSAESPDVSWEAYWLSVGVPGRPYVLEVNYPSDVPQTLGISILEPNAAGALLPIGLDSGVDVPEELPGPAPHWARHRLVFWPRTATPLVLLTNRRERQPAVYGKIRVLGGWEHLPRPTFGCPTGAPSGCWPPTWTGRCCRKTSRPAKRPTPGAAAAWTIGRPSTRPARGWSSTSTTPATTA